MSGTRYYYAVSAVDAAGNASALSAESSAIAVDDLPPAVPTGLAAVGGTGQVALTWTANGESDLAGYDLYRNGTKVNTTPLTGTSFTDTGRAAGTMYSYRLASVDTHGNASAQCSPVTATTSGTAGGLVDGGFENGSDGAALGLPWYIGGTPQHAEYDSARARNGSLSGWIQGPTAATYASFGETTTANMTSNGAEQRFWVYFDSTNQFRAMDNWIAGAADRPFYIQFANDGNIYVYTDRPGNPNGYTTAGHTRVGTYATGWTEVRVINTFSGTGPQSYTLSVRRNATDLWTPLKASGATGYNIPFRGTNNITKTGGLLFGAYQNANMWIDDLRYSPTSQFSIRATAGAGGSISPSGTQTFPYGTDSGPYTITPAPGRSSPTCSSTASRSGRSRATRSPTFAPTTRSPRRSGRSGADMPITPIDCAQCHAGDDHGDGPDCGDCHWISDGHPGTPSDMHIPADVTGCTPCHDASLTIEHNGRTPDAGGTFDVQHVPRQHRPARGQRHSHQQLGV